MSPHLFSLAMNEIDDQYIEEALSYHAAVKPRHIKCVLRYAAMICLWIVLGFGTVLAVSAEAREVVFGWVKEQYETWTYYEYRDEAENDGPDIETGTLFVPHELTEVPPGYTEIARDVDLEIGHQLIIYQNEETGRHFIVAAGSGGNVFVETEGNTVQPVDVAGVKGELYLPDDPTKDSCIVWMKEKIYFYISGYFTAEELVHYAECFQPVTETEDAQDDSESTNPKSYRLGYIPEGYTYYGDSETPSHNAAIYVNDEGHSLSFYCITEPEGSAMTIIHNDHTHATATVHGVEANLQISNIPDEDSSSITWEEDGILFYIAAFLPKDELIALAESVEEVPLSEMEEER